MYQKTCHACVFVLRNVDQDLFEEVQTRMRDPIFLNRVSERIWKSEGLFAEAKENHNLARGGKESAAEILNSVCTWWDDPQRTVCRKWLERVVEVGVVTEKFSGAARDSRRCCL